LAFWYQPFQQWILIEEQILALGTSSFEFVLDMAFGALKLVLGTLDLPLGAQKQVLEPPKLARRAPQKFMTTEMTKSTKTKNLKKAWQMMVYLAIC